MPEKAALYLRSSKDRHDVSIDAQRDELHRLAKNRNIEIVREFVDVVESAKDEHRPAFQALRSSFKDHARNWSIVMLLEPSRLSRNQYIAHVFTHDAHQSGISVVYARMPESNPMVDIIITPLMHGFAEYHSWESKQKGLAGMAENVKRGFRAGGRAPYGYCLKHEPTGAVRDGQPVTKSHLEPDENAPKAAKYLSLRAAGSLRRSAKRQAGIALPDTTLIGLEWNALTYSGCTVWNVHNERTRDGYVGGTKRRPRSDWVIKEDTHPALITREEAEALLKDIEARRSRRRYDTPAYYVLSGLLHTPSGEPWYGCRDGDVRYYRHGRRVNSDAVERAVLGKVAEDLKSDKFVKALVHAAHKLESPEDEIAEIARAYASIEELDRKIQKVTGMLAEGIERPLLAQIGMWEQEREKIRAGIIDLETRLVHARAVAGITEKDVLQILDNLANDMASLDRNELKDFLRGIIGKVAMDPETLSCQIHYTIPAATGELMASPRGCEPIPLVNSTMCMLN